MTDSPALLQITDGTTTIDLLADDTGYHLYDWQPVTADYKNGGTWQDSPLADGRRLVARQYGNIIETFELKARGADPNKLIHISQNLRRMLEFAASYWVTDWQDTPVYLVARASCESNTRYAAIFRGRIAEDSNPYSQPFMQPVGQKTVMDNLTLVIERGQWLALPPHETVCLPVSAQQDWGFEALWQTATSSPSAQVTALLQTANGYIYAGEAGGRIYRSTDGGDTWALNVTLASASVVGVLFQAANGDIYAGQDGEFWRSVNQGGSWSLNSNDPSGGVVAFIQLPNGRILVGSGTSPTAALFYSDNNGASWTGATLPSGNHIISAFLRLADGTLLAGDISQILQSTDNGATWTVNTYQPIDSSSNVTDLIQLANGYILAGVSGGTTLVSTDEAVTWTEYTSDTGGPFVQTADGDLYAAGATTIILRSTDNGASWFTDWDGAAGDIAVFLLTTDDIVFAGDDGQVLRRDPDSFVALGQEESCNNTFVANKHVMANLTNIKLFDTSAATYTDVFPASSFPHNLLPSTFDSGDIVYFGSNTAVSDDTGPFTSLIFDIATPLIGTVSSTAWEYWNGAAWASIASLIDNTQGFTINGVNGVFWIPAADWATTAINGVTAYWVRFRMITGSGSAPTQQNRDVYAVVVPFVEIEAADIGGDLPALLTLKMTTPNTYPVSGLSYSNRVVCGLRSYNRGENFTAYLNAGGEQNPPGVTVTAGTSTSFTAEARSPSGMRATYNPAGVESMAARVTFTLDTSIARDFYGTYRAFLRGMQNGGSVGDISVRLVVTAAVGGISFTGPTRTFVSTTVHSYVELGRISLPGSGLLKLTELTDNMQLIIQASSLSATPDLYVFDLVLIPVDEWSGDFVDKVENSSSRLEEHYLEVDSNYFKRPQRAIIKYRQNGLITSIWQNISSGEAILQANARQRLWFLACRTGGFSHHYLVHKVQLYINQRYLSMRGQR